VLGTSSGFQSAQFRELEYRLGIKDPRYLDYQEGGTEARNRLQAALDAPSLWDEADLARQRLGAESWLAVYRDAERWFELYQLAEKLVDIDDALSGWRHKHLLTVERIIGMKPGTGGSAGAAYLASTLEKRAYPELWAVRTSL
jgi:tryptophan 2,3-dioxygenase